jgi:hypothetical protein
MPVFKEHCGALAPLFCSLKLKNSQGKEIAYLLSGEVSESEGV